MYSLAPNLDRQDQDDGQVLLRRCFSSRFAAHILQKVVSVWFILSLVELWRRYMYYLNDHVVYNTLHMSVYYAMLRKMDR